MKPAAWSTKRGTPQVRQPYTRDGWLTRHYVAGYALMALAAGAYGYLFASFGGLGGKLAPFIAPLALLAGLIFWTLPELRRPPVVLLDRLFAVFLFALLIWPDYLALTLPGLPWITAIRLVGFPLAFTLLLCAFGSSAFRARLYFILSSDRVLFHLLAGFMAICVATLGFSHNIGGSVNRLIVAFVSWFCIFFASCWYFSFKGRAVRFTRYLLVIFVCCLIVAVIESRLERLPWAGHIPSILDVENPLINILLQGTRRAASGIYRVQSKFSTSIGLGEFISMSLPLLLHELVFSRSKWIKIVIALTLPVTFYIVLKTDSRLAFIGFFSSILLYTFAAAILRWRRVRDSLVGPALVLAYPVLAAFVVLLSLFWHRLRVLIWGGGAQQFSTQSRADQMHMGLPIVMHNPLGHGIGQGAVTLGYTAPGFDFVTIDSYYLAVALEFGVVGFAAFYGMFAWAVLRAGRTALHARDPELLFITPAAIALLNFLLSKSIYAETENQPLAFMLLGMIVALQYRSSIEGERRRDAPQRPTATKALDASA